MATALTPLANLTLGSAASTVTFSSISSSYRDLVLIGNFSLSANNYPWFHFNGDTGGNYSYVELGISGAPSSTTGNGVTNIYFDNFTGFTSNAQFQMHILDYSATDKHKTGLLRAGDPGVGQTLATAFRYASTSALSSITLTAGFSTTKFAVGSTFALYGVSA